MTICEFVAPRRKTYESDTPFCFVFLFFNATRKDFHIIATKGLLAAKMVRVLVGADDKCEGRLTGQFECAGQSCSH